MSIVRWNLKEAGCGEHTNPWANLWSDEQKPYMRLGMRVRLQSKLKPNNYTESFLVDMADRWRGKKRVVPGEVCVKCSERSNHHRKVMLNAQKSAEVIVSQKDEGPNQ